MAPRPYIIVEGLLGYHSRAMRECYDVKLFLEPAEELRVRWKTQRDTAKRGYSREEVLRQIAEREHDTQAHIRPQRTFADIVVTFYPPAGPRRGERAAPERAPHPAPDPAASRT